MRWIGWEGGARGGGVGVCDPDEAVVTPLTTLAFAGAEPFADVVAALVGERSVEGIVVGVPVTGTGEGRGERRVRRVVEALHGRLSIPVEECDERGTTAVAAERLREAGVPPHRHRERIDAVAAAVILESFLAGRRGAAGRR
jgi:putative Holliday junction resolvase